MYILELSQNENKIELAVFDSIEEGRNFLSKFPGYVLKESKNDVEEYINAQHLPEYLELEFNGNILPITKFMFSEENRIDIFWKEIPNLSKKGEGMLSGSTKVDAYYIENTDVKEYIEKRESTYKIINEHLSKKGYKVARMHRGSEDGETVAVYNENAKSWDLVCHLSPYYINNPKILEDIDEIIVD